MNRPPVRLLAKSTRDPNQPAFAETLPGHLKVTGEVAHNLVDLRGKGILEALRLSPEAWLDALAACLPRAALIHDLGKANEEFQAMARGKREPQALRHEVVALWLFTAFPQLDSWLFGSLTPDLRWVVLRAVAGHHLQFSPSASTQPKSSGRLRVRVYTEHSDFRDALDSIGDSLGLGRPPAASPGALDLVQMDALEAVVAAGQEWWDRSDLDLRRFAAAVAALVIAADVCASAEAKPTQTRLASGASAWAVDALETSCSSDDLQNTAEKRLGGAPPRPFQLDVANIESRIGLVTAGCGTGKTIAAYLWAARRLHGKKLFFSYPTTGTASEGFADYAWPEFRDDAVLAHSRAALDLERILANAPAEEDSVVRHLKYQGLQVWAAKATVCTVDSVLGLVQNQRLGLFAFPALAGAGFVFDEVHLYDYKLFGSLLAFLEALPGLPVLLMTATLPPGHRRALEELAASRGERLEEVRGPRELEELPRYRILRGENAGAEAAARQAAASGGRVLWVTNTVDRCRHVARDLSSKGIRVLPYHSRYRYIDRLDRHSDVMSAFNGQHGFVAVTTQVCEVSLDISADLLVTELAPPAALIQRLGRLNRRATPEANAGPRDALVLKPKDSLPYEDSDMALGARWLDLTTGALTSQEDLSRAFIDVVGEAPTANRAESAWLDGGWSILRDAVREDGVTASFIRDEDIPLCRASNGRVDSKEVQRYIVPMTTGPVLNELRGWDSFGPAIHAPADRIIYDSIWGAEWRR